MSYKIKITDLALKQYNKINDPYHTQIKRKIDDLSDLNIDRAICPGCPLSQEYRDRPEQGKATMLSPVDEAQHTLFPGVRRCIQQVCC